MTAALPPERRVRLTKLLGLLGSDHVGERANAGAMADKLIREAGLTWESLLNGAAERKPPPAYDPWEIVAATNSVLAEGDAAHSRG